MIAHWFVHTVTVETFLGQGANGDLFAAPVKVVGWLSGSRKIVRGIDGQQAISESAFYTNISNAALFTTDTRVTDSLGTVSRVIRVNVNDTGGLMQNVEHVAVALT